MCDCIPSPIIPYSCIRLRKSGFSRSTYGHRALPIRDIITGQCLKDLSSLRNLGRTRVTNCGLHVIGSSFGSNGLAINKSKSTNSIKVGRNSSSSGSDEHEFYRELGLKEKQEQRIELEKGENGQKYKKNSSLKNGSEGPAFSGMDFLELDQKCGTENTGRLKDEDLVKIEGSEESEPRNVIMKRGKQMTRRSNMIAKQVIGIQSALSLGFVSQLWVDTNSWIVLIVELRPNLLSSEVERIFLEDISQVGDVVLIQDESVIVNEFQMVGLETLVGYNVVTPGRRNIGKVRGYTFNIHSGVVESLELDSFGISIIPSTLVSTYALFVEDVLEVVSDTVVVHEAAASRIQRLTKGFWDARKVGSSIDEPVQSDYSWDRRRSFTSRKSHPSADDWELPMDYL